MSVEQRITQAWQNNSLWLNLLRPLSWLFRLLSAARRAHLQSRYQGRRFSAPVVVVGNVSVGGSGKTPLIVALVDALKQRGFSPGVVSRGYGGKANSYPLAVTSQTPVSESGDEPLLIAKLTQCPLVVDTDRRAAVTYLLSHYDCDVVLSDDGLQHYSMHRDIEIVVVDRQRGFGNGLCLPAGPLRESPGRAQQADFVVVNGGANTMPLNIAKMACETMSIAPRRMTQLLSGASQSIEQWHLLQPVKRVHAVAAIGNPRRFADTLAELGLDAELHCYDDHQALTAANLTFDDDLAVIITAKDAVKIMLSESNPIAENIWVLDVEAVIESVFIDKLVAQLQALNATQSKQILDR